MSAHAEIAVAWGELAQYWIARASWPHAEARAVKYATWAFSSARIAMEEGTVADVTYCVTCDGTGTIDDLDSPETNWDGVDCYDQMPCPVCDGTGEPEAV